MTVKNFAESMGYDIVVMPEPEREITGGYAGDLLSWVMGRLPEGSAWVTIMSNVNVVAVATLSDPACVILSEGVSPDDGVVQKADIQGVNILRTGKDSFSVCADIRSVL